uniref:PID domain-containing protein n=1 Tax=Timema shepardi TaxID=629360 RepID=A0A7R9B634_TIMSH|nr:unnamed protein product [Timema shepardi]
MASLVLTDSSQLTPDSFKKLLEQNTYPYAEPDDLQKHVMPRPFQDAAGGASASFISKPARGWLHPDQLINKEGITYAVRWSVRDPRFDPILLFGTVDLERGQTHPCEDSWIAAVGFIVLTTNVGTIFVYMQQLLARQPLFTQLTGCASFPLKFCGVRWLENAKCFQRALQIWDHVVKFLKEAKLPETKPVETLKRAACDPFLKCKLTFCKTIVDECQSFLQRFQASKPMTPYLFEAVEKLLRYRMNRGVKPDLMKYTGPKLLSIDTKKSENLILSKTINVEKRVTRAIGDQPLMDFAGANVNLSISSMGLVLTALESGRVIARHEMPRISFASGGDTVIRHTLSSPISR